MSLQVESQSTRAYTQRLDIICFFVPSPPPRTERQWRDLAHCLSHINFSERCVRRLQENFACFQNTLVDAEVFSSFTSIVNKAKKFAKPEVKVRVQLVVVVVMVVVCACVCVCVC